MGNESRTMQSILRGERRTLIGKKTRREGRIQAEELQRRMKFGMIWTKRKGRRAAISRKREGMHNWPAQLRAEWQRGREERKGGKTNRQTLRHFLQRNWKKGGGKEGRMQRSRKEARTWHQQSQGLEGRGQRSTATISHSLLILWLNDWNWNQSDSRAQFANCTSHL